MNKKTFFKISATALILGVSITLSVKYFPAVALAIKSGVIASAAHLVAFAIFTIIALASAAAFIKYVVSAIRSNNAQGKPNGVSGEPRSQKKEEGQSLVQEEVAPTPTPSLLPRVTEEVTGTVLQQPDNNLTKDMETPQPEKDDCVVANGDSAEQQITLESLNSFHTHLCHH
ncbi:MAG: hypothetical protein PG981_000025 [Wolbachia endosymbiont of Ctenocephalides orientis wCori]|nr:MAG: hypothetical protein PG981_000025 [Wolbachia endosymbiont of Ctenocephalides orientis wCori]